MGNMLDSRKLLVLRSMLISCVIGVGFVRCGRMIALGNRLRTDILQFLIPSDPIDDLSALIAHVIDRLGRETGSGVCSLRCGCSTLARWT